MPDANKIFPTTKINEKSTLIPNLSSNLLYIKQIAKLKLKTTTSIVGYPCDMRPQ